ncbi:MAG: hypothetical protein ACREM6_16190, partial [Vulcanimicrobiaceae bacterium]
AMAETRTALQHLVDQLGAQLALPAREHTPFGRYAETVIEQLEARQTDRDRGYALLASLLKAAFGFASKPGHHGLASAERADAEFVLSLATALYVQLVRNPIA